MSPNEKNHSTKQQDDSEEGTDRISLFSSSPRKRASILGRRSSNSLTSFALSQSDGLWIAPATSHQDRNTSHLLRPQSIIVKAQHPEALSLSGIPESKTAVTGQPDVVEMSFVLMFENGQQTDDASPMPFVLASGSCDASWDEKVSRDSATIEPISSKLRSLPREVDFHASGSSFCDLL